MKKSGLQINFSNRWLYTLILVGIVLVGGGIVYAYGTSNPAVFGHTMSEVAPPSGCNSGQVLSWTGSVWSCINSSSGGLTSESDPKVGTLINGRWCRTDGSQVICDLYYPLSSLYTASFTYSWISHSGTSCTSNCGGTGGSCLSGFDLNSGAVSCNDAPVGNIFCGTCNYFRYCLCAK